jgi:predicted protein tyrosine phosphatase
MPLPRLHIASWDLAQGVLSHPVAGPKITHVISINNPGSSPPPALASHHGRHLVLKFHDLSKPSRELKSPTQSDVGRILEFGREIGGAHRVLVHCAAGISRSSAAALAIIASKMVPSSKSADEAIQTVLKVKQLIHPNRLMVKFIDAQLGYQGALVKAHAVAFPRDIVIPGVD